ncbi:CPBP family intramembrane glutamic endopeptidase [Clostridium sp. DJ247]|uniref:CPBP family intramembrane glutamic endopeptidase n=1 Tax=Clostridium sp. DJ247 TaxID=2726188 RepID=UPI001624D8FD|nr:CPBP family intramembrane glutamic endopeptidase [Clostridium sp. DJ247]MBC2579816.1 CPBP family intramembrane metalloprotease [Clostridium sp. DJ247]
MTGIDILKDALVFLFVYMPPLLLFWRFWKERDRSYILLILISIIYIILSLITQNLIPFIFVLLNIRYIRLSGCISNFSRNNQALQYGISYSGDSISNRIAGDYDRYNFSLKKFNIIYAIIFVFISYIIIILMSIVETSVITKFNIQVQQQEIVTIMTDMPLKAFLLVIPVVTIFAPVLEEFVFRWLLFERIFKPRIGVYLSAILSSITFAFVHFNLRAFPVLLFIGLYNCYLIHKKGYWYSVFNHFTFNSITTLALLLEKLGIVKF